LDFTKACNNVNWKKLDQTLQYLNFGQLLQWLNTSIRIIISIAVWLKLDLQQMHEVAEMAKVPYRNVAGCLMYLTAGTQADIAAAISAASQFLGIHA